MSRKVKVRTAVADVKLEELRKAFQAFGAQMSTQVEGMRQAFNKNHAAYAQAFNHIDAKLNVIQAIINDLHDKTSTLDEAGHIDWDHYYGAYKEYLRGLVEQEQETQQAAATVSVEVIQELQEEVFGGDYGTGSQTGGDREVSEVGVEASGKGDPRDQQGGTGLDDGEGADANAVPEVSRDDGADARG